MPQSENHIAAMRVLVVHQSFLLRLGVRTMLASWPHLRMCGEAECPAEARSLFVSERPDVVVTGLTMAGGLDGITFIHDLLELRHVPTVVMTQRRDFNSCERALRAGVRGYVLADDEPSELRRAIDQAVAGDFYASPAVLHHMLRTVASLNAKRRAPIERLSQLSDREMQVYRLTVGGIRPGEIALRLNVSVKTVNTHFDRIKLKLGIRSRQELQRWVKLCARG